MLGGAFGRKLRRMPLFLSSCAACIAHALMEASTGWQHGARSAHHALIFSASCKGRRRPELMEYKELGLWQHIAMSSLKRCGVISYHPKYRNYASVLDHIVVYYNTLQDWETKE